METNEKKMKMVFTVVERAPGKSFWTRIGLGFVNRDGSLTLRLDAIPTNGTMQVRDWQPVDGERRPHEADAETPTRGRRDISADGPL
jgi:hypothetical protein